ncbi:hypothetical protein P3J6_121490 [Pseudoalteromonas sp. 3J6]|nr:hypothetical protein P3J6_121490 [Pseudoalteromonas sp. 3J6]
MYYRHVNLFYLITKKKISKTTFSSVTEYIPNTPHSLNLAF